MQSMDSLKEIAKLLDKLFETSKIIEKDGVDGIQKAIEIGGKEMALGMLVIQLRRDMGSMNSFPSDPGIDDKILAIIVEHKLL